MSKSPGMCLARIVIEASLPLGEMCWERRRAVVRPVTPALGGGVSCCHC